MTCLLEPYYQPPIPHSASEALPCLRQKESLTIGYGCSGTLSREYYVDDGFDVDVGFLKIFASTEYVDYALVEQMSPFDRDTPRAIAKTSRVYREPIWDSKVITVVQKKLFDI